MSRWEDGPIVAPSVDYKEKYFELLYAVANKYPGETRHQTALRCIRSCESSTDNQGKCEKKK